MRSKLPIAVLCGFLLMALAACGGGGDGARITELEADLVAEQEAREQAEEKAEEAELKRQEEETAHIEAEAAADTAAAEAADKIEEAKDDAAEAEQQRQEEEDKRQAVEADNQRLENAARERAKADAAERARTAISGSRTIDGTDTFTVGAIKYGEPAPVTAPPGPFTASTGRSGSWSTTSLTAHAEPTRDMIQIYSDVEAPARIDFKDSDYNDGTEAEGAITATTVVRPYEQTGDAVTKVIDATGKLAGWLDLTPSGAGNRPDATSSVFPESGPAKSFTLADRGEFTTTERDDPDFPDDDEYTGRYRDPDVDPQRYEYEVSGNLGGAGGTYRCGSDDLVSCTVRNTGSHFVFSGPWTFRPSSGTAKVIVPDAEYMWFGVWARQTVRLGGLTPNQPTETWAFEANHGGNGATGNDSNVVTDLGAATGSATYQGPAAGRYAVYEPDTGDSGIGSFTASATLRADFDADTVSGTITGFSNDPGWSLALKRKDIDGGTVEAAEVTWTIDGLPDDNGSWEARFYNNLPTTGGTVDYQPHGIAGTFEAAYDPSGVGARAALIGGFGAHRP